MRICIRENLHNSCLFQYQCFLDDQAFQPLKNIMKIYEIVVRKPAHLNGGLLDHVYIYKMFLRKKRVNAIAKNVYSTVHDAVK